MIAPWRPHCLVNPACQAPAALLAVAAIGSVVTAVGSISQGIAANNAAKYDQAVDRNNAIQAQDASQAQAAVAEQQTRTKLGQQAAAYGASGVDTNTGTPVDVLTDTAAKGRLDAMTIRYGGNVSAQRDISAGTLAAYQGSEAETAGVVQGAGSLLTSGSSIYKTFGGKAGGT